MPNIIHIPNTSISTFDIKRSELSDLADLVSNRQKNPEFMKFLKETPMTKSDNLVLFQKDFDSEHTRFKGIQLEGHKKVIGFLLFHCFNQQTGEIELGFRIDPSLQHKGVCTSAVQQSLRDILLHNDISSICGWHSARNKGSFGVFNKSGFSLNTFIEHQTFLPNINKITDDFKWKLCKTFHETSPSDLKQVELGLNKHNLNTFFTL